MSAAHPKYGTWIGVLGGGQLGRMLAIEARRMGFSVIQWTGGDLSGAESMADTVLATPFHDTEALETFLQIADYVTVEFENIPLPLLQHIERQLPTYPSSQSIRICQDRQLEKEFLSQHGIPTADFRIVENADQLALALADLPGDVIIKTAQFGYDGKGQKAIPVHNRPPAAELWAPFSGIRCIVEQKITLVAELSVMVARAQDGTILTYDPAENEHVNHILHLSTVPARLPLHLTEEVRQTAEALVQALDYVGVIGIEFFLNEEGKLLVNEMAPRPHNSGHHTLDACATSQFEQQARIVTGLPLGSTELLKPVVMWNLLGDLWQEDGSAPDWAPLLALPLTTLHLYGKRAAKEKRKMGHVTFLSTTAEDALRQAHFAIEHYSP